MWPTRSPWQWMAGWTACRASKLALTLKRARWCCTSKMLWSSVPSISNNILHQNNSKLMRLHPQIQVLCMSLLLQEHGNGSRKLGPNLLRTNNVTYCLCQKNAPHGIWGTRMISGFVWTAGVTNKTMADRQIYDEDNNNDDCQHNKLDFEVLEPHLASQLLSLSLKVISLQWKNTIHINPQKRQLYFKTSLSSWIAVTSWHYTPLISSAPDCRCTKA